jgi:hypothetical protein
MLGKDVWCMVRRAAEPGIERRLVRHLLCGAVSVHTKGASTAVFEQLVLSRSLGTSRGVVSEGKQFDGMAVGSAV